MKENLLIIFAKAPVKGKVKTRLAKAIGEDKALAVYQKLLAHTRQATDQLTICDKALYFSEEDVQDEHLWPQSEYSRHTQSGRDLGERMYQAMRASFGAGYKRVVIIGTDCPELTAAHIQEAFDSLGNVPVAIGPATDGGYYLIGCSELLPEIFFDKSWSSEYLLQETLLTLLDIGKKELLLPPLSDIDELSVLARFPAFAAGPLASTSG